MDSQAISHYRILSRLGGGGAMTTTETVTYDGGSVQATITRQIEKWMTNNDIGIAELGQS
jgi:hypothetical protein